MAIDSMCLARTKAVLQQVAVKLPTATFCGIPAEAFDREDLLLMLSMTMDSARQERKAHVASMELMRSFAKVGGKRVTL